MKSGTPEEIDLMELGEVDIVGIRKHTAGNRGRRHRKNGMRKRFRWTH